MWKYWVESQKPSVRIVSVPEILTCEISYIWDILHVRYITYEISYTWDILHMRYLTCEISYIWDILPPGSTFPMRTQMQTALFLFGWGLKIFIPVYFTVLHSFRHCIQDVSVTAVLITTAGMEYPGWRRPPVRQSSMLDIRVKERPYTVVTTWT